MSLSTNKMFYVSWEAFHRATKELAHQLLGKNYSAIVAVSRGGLVPAAILARELNIRVVDSICVASYEHDKQGSLSVLKDASLADSEQLLVVDDLVVTVYAKPQGKPLVDHYITDIEQDTWIQLPWDMELAYSKPLADK